MQKKRMLITGISGLLGNNIAYCLKNTYDIVGLYHTHQCEMDGIRTVGGDLTSGEDVHVLIKEVNPEIIVHCAAQADVDVCEEHPAEAQRINVSGTQNLIENMSGSESKFIYISTDLVYDGGKQLFSEEDPVKPLNHYGITKCQAEKESLKKKDALVLRTNFFGWNVQNKYSLGEWVIHELGQNKEMLGFTDCHFSSIYTFELAKLLDLAIKKNLCGIYNCTSSTSMSKYEFVSEIAGRLGLEKGLIKPISIDDFKFRAKRSKNLNLNTGKLARDLDINIPTISFSIDRFIEDFKSGVPERIRPNDAPKNIYPENLDVIPYGRQCIDDEDITAVVDVLKSVSITQGPKVREFESVLCRLTDASFGVVVNSGTSGLHIACLTAEIGPGDEVITSPNTFVASANCVVYCGGKPIFADIAPQTYNISPRDIEQKINKRTKAVIPVHFAGQSCDMEAIENIVRASEKKYGHKIYIIEDACHALGSKYKNTQVGSCAHSDMAVMSFHPVKHITTGEGGCVLT
ncbi:MAG: aminotransferase class I/II-fold pyridoxal phosphate-dependent enzyme, partial [Spirochaetes bacterium]|nr:aminotransferase class I/II-fold pyridoxal phosphate-dependent enzyme [Spirochaetota bacterium]